MPERFWCLLLGHVWYIRPAERAYGPWRVCRRCQAFHGLQAVPAATHPDTMAPLDLAAEQLLAAYEIELEAP